MARRAIILGINQTIMMALSMVVITALDRRAGPRQEHPPRAPADRRRARVRRRARDRDHGHHPRPADVRRRASGWTRAKRDGRTPRFAARLARRPVRPSSSLGGSVAASSPAGRIVGDRRFPTRPRSPSGGPINDAVELDLGLNLYARDRRRSRTSSRTALINPIEAFLTDVPVVADRRRRRRHRAAASAAGGRRSSPAVCLVGIIALEIWEHSMVNARAGPRRDGADPRDRPRARRSLPRAATGSRASCGRSSTRPRRCPRSSTCIPAVALFGPTRFTAIVAAVIYAVPPVIRLVEIGIRAVPPTVRRGRHGGRARRSASCSGRSSCRWRGRRSCVAANQGIVLVLAMVVVGGFVGGGRARLRRRRRLRPARLLRRGPRGRRSRSSCSASCSTGSRRAPAPRGSGGATGAPGGASRAQADDARHARSDSAWIAARRGASSRAAAVAPGRWTIRRTTDGGATA